MGNLSHLNLRDVITRQPDNCNQRIDYGKLGADNDTSRAREALEYLNAGCDRETWHKIGRAAIAAGLTVEELDTWSATGGNYKGTSDVKAAFRTIKPEGGTGAGTLFHLAREAGWRDDSVGPQRQAPARTRPVELPRKPAPGMGADEVWSRCEPATAQHAYIVAKRAVGVPLDTLRVVPAGDPLVIQGESMVGALVVPMRQADGTLLSLQFVNVGEVAAHLKTRGKSSKLNLAGCPVKGWFTVGELVSGGLAYVVEGVGQAWACWQATGQAAVVCFGAGNMRKVAAELRQQDPGARLVLVPDVGKEADAQKIAAEVGAAVAVMPEGEANNFDASDLAQRDGCDALALLLKAAETPPTPTALPAHAGKPGGFEFVSARELLIPKPVYFLIDETIETASLAMLFGAIGSGKSFTAIGWSCAVATGTPWFDREVKQGAVFYLAGEGHAGLSRRLAAWELHTGHSLEAAPLFVSKVPAQLMNLSSANAVMGAIGKLSAEHGNPALIVVDTFARNMGAGDENSNADIAVFVNHIDQMRARLGCVVLLVHHTGHMEGDRARGGSALPAAMDSIYRMDSKVSGMSLVNIKAKEAELSEPLAVTIEQLELPNWIDAKGRVMKSAVLVAGVKSTVPYEKPLTKVQNDALSAFSIAAREHGILGPDGRFAGLHVEAWRVEVYRTSTADTPEAKRKSFQRAREALVERGQVSVDNDIYRLKGVQAFIEPSFTAALHAKTPEMPRDDDHGDTGQDRDIDGTCPGVASL